MAMTPDDFKHRLLELQKVIFDAVAYFSLWRALSISDQGKVDALNRYNAFFLPAKIALNGMSLLQLAKVFDRDKRTVSLRILLSAAMESPESLVPNVSFDELQGVADMIDDKEEQLERLKRYRDQRLAHHDSNPEGDMSVLFGETRDLLEAVLSMYNILRQGNDRSMTFFDNLTRDPERHTAQVVELMVKERERIRMGGALPY